jgi:hypothetical protein
VDIGPDSRLLWVSVAHAGATADITIVREDKAAKAFVLKREGQPDSHPTPIHKKQIKTAADLAYNKELQSKRQVVERFFGRTHNLNPAFDKPLQATEEACCVHLRGIVAMTGWSIENSPLNADDTRAHRAWKAARREAIAAARRVPVADVGDSSSYEPEPEPVELTPERVRDGRLAAIPQLNRVMKEFAKDDPLGAIRRWGQLHPRNPVLRRT